ncbi:MAG: NAD(P)/FAD-dependent oxidoreductase, partial [Candidatus Omnitrophica bacterium]|nr:NAD(P)/FAD-dependent oxidoreductase [Candidatus Omnitrophota bacterium]
MIENKYDVAIIGAGIGGLVCGGYLAKAGLKVLIVEQHSQVGGYCTAFRRKGYVFDVGAHSFGSLRPGGIFFKILEELDVAKEIKFITNELIDRIITPDYTVHFGNNIENTREELKKCFVREAANIDLFFNFILETEFFTLVAKTRNISFADFLDSFFADDKLKAILSIPLVNIGLPSSEASALISLILYREFIFDGGYYPQGGTQILPNVLAARFRALGGKIVLSDEVTKIQTRNNRVQGIVTRKHGEIAARYVVSNADATLTFAQLLDCVTPESRTIQ